MEVELLIQRLSAGGRGVARVDGKVWFIPGVVPGDLVRARVRRERSRYVEAIPVEILRHSALRREPACPIQARCGGCPWMVLAEAEQRHWKRSMIEDAFRHIGGFEPSRIEGMRSGRSLLGYRNKVELTIGRDKAGRPSVGFIGGAGRPELIDVADCPIVHHSANALLASVRTYLLDAANDLDPVFEGKERLRCLIRRSSATGEMLVALREVESRFPEIARFADFIGDRHPHLAGVVHLQAEAGRRGGAREEIIRGRGWIGERIEGLEFRLGAASFFQVNTEMAVELTRLVCELAGRVEGIRTFDLYGGIGIFGLSLAAKGARVVVCEADRAAVDAGRESAGRCGIPQARFKRSDVRRFLADRMAARDRAGLVVANPPRTGLGKGVAEAILDLRPERIVLVSCDPATLARDLRIFSARQWRPVRIIPVDLFPQTAHVEVVALLRREGEAAATSG